MLNKCQLVRQTCAKVCENSKFVRLVPENLEALALKFAYTPFNEFPHHQLDADSDVEQNLLYLFILDSLNFCFWPLQNFEYQNLADNVRRYVQGNSGLQGLVAMTQEQLSKQIFNGVKVPLADQRARILRQMSSTIRDKFEGSVLKLVTAAKGSAVLLLDLLTCHFPNFQDHSVYRGHQIHFYKRAQILIGDIYAKFEGQGIGCFHDIGELTMFPDYRVPQILNHHGVLQYSEPLQAKIDSRIEIGSGCEEEVEIRASSVAAVEQLRHILKAQGRNVSSIQVDWFLWEEGEKNLKTIKQHHRTLTIYY